MTQKSKPNELSKKDANVLENTIIVILFCLWLIGIIAIPLYLHNKWGDGPAVASLVGILVLTMIFLDLSDGEESKLKALFASYTRIAKRGVWLVKHHYSQQTFFDEPEACSHSWEIDYTDENDCDICGYVWHGLDDCPNCRKGEAT